MKAVGLALLFLLTGVVVADWETPEHIDIGNQPEITQAIKKLFGENKPTITLKNYISNADSYKPYGDGIEVSFGHIIALAGDHYAGSPIVEDNAKKYNDNFFAAFSQLYFLQGKDNSEREKDKQRLEQMLWLIEHDEYVSENLGRGIMDIIYFLASEGRYLQYAAINDDHFSNTAKVVFNTGLKRATTLAEYACQQGLNYSDSYYQQAMASAGFASHYLTDYFAGGHQLVDRQVIRDTIYNKTTQLRKKYIDLENMICADFPDQESELNCSKVVRHLVTSIYTKPLHDYGNKHGVNVRNAKTGEKWKAYGDDHYNDDGNAKNREKVKKAVLEMMTKTILAAMNKEKQCQYIPHQRVLASYLPEMVVDSKKINIQNIMCEEDKHNGQPDSNNCKSYQKLLDDATRD